MRLVTQWHAKPTTMDDIFKILDEKYYELIMKMICQELLNDISCGSLNSLVFHTWSTQNVYLVMNVSVKYIRLALYPDA